MSWDFFQKPKMQNEVPGKSKALIQLHIEQMATNYNILTSNCQQLLS